MSEQDKEIYQNDDVGAFGGSITVTLDNPNDYTVTKVDFMCGNYFETVENPVFPLTFKPSREYTVKFKPLTPCYLRVYDSNGLRKTASGELIIPVKKEVVKKDDGLCC